jgi:hypothetical protein
MLPDFLAELIQRLLILSIHLKERMIELLQRKLSMVVFFLTVVITASLTLTLSWKELFTAALLLLIFSFILTIFGGIDYG